MGSPTVTQGDSLRWASRHPELGTDRIASYPYTSTQFLAEELTAVFRGCWLNVAREEDLPHEGSYLALDLGLLGASVLLIRDRSGEIRALHNVCTHRGTRLVPIGAGRASVLTCRYHGWSFSSDGRLLSVPDERGFAGLDKSHCGLSRIHCDRWQGYVFVNLATEPPEPLADYMADLDPAFRDYPFSRLRRQVTYVAEVEANWKVALDIGEEPYHFLFVHRKSIPDSHTGVGQELAYFPSIRLYGEHRSSSIVANPSHRMRPSEAIAYQQAATIIQGADPSAWAPGLNLDRVDHWAFDVHVLFPNCAVLLGAGWTVVHRFWPLSERRTRWETTLHMTAARTAGELLSQEFSKILTRDLLREDLAMVEMNQAGLQSGALNQLWLHDEEIMLRHSLKAVENRLAAGGAGRTKMDGVSMKRGRRVAIHDARVIDCTGRPPQDRRTLLIEDDRIVAILASEHDQGIDALRIDAAGRTVIPGLIDMHAHLLSGGFDTVVDTGASYGELTQRRALAQMLYWGVTSCHFSVQPLTNVRWLRAGLSSGDIAGPRLYLSGPGVTAPRGWAGSNLPDARLELDSVDDVPSAIGRLAEHGVDFIKIFYDDMCCAFHRAMPKLNRTVMQAVIREAHRHGLPVAVHVYELDGHLEVLEAGGDLLYHSAVTGAIDDRYIRLARASGSAYIATLSIYNDTYDPDAVRAWSASPEVQATVPSITLDTLGAGGPLDAFESFTKRDAMRRNLPTIMDNLRRIHEAGVPFAVGPDTGVPGVFPGISVHREMELMVKAGVPPANVLQAATRQAAALLGDPLAGTIERGKRADFLLLDADPLVDIRATRAIAAVWQNGAAVDRRRLLTGAIGPSAAQAGCRE